MSIHSISIINKAGKSPPSLALTPEKGGLIYQKDYSDGIKKLSTNDLLILAGTFQ
jgi:hypothetical protein